MKNWFNLRHKLSFDLMKISQNLILIFFPEEHSLWEEHHLSKKAMSKDYSHLIVKRETVAERETERIDCNDNGWSRV